MKKYFFAAIVATIISLAFAFDTNAQNLPDEIVIRHGSGGFGGGTRMTEEVTYIVAYDEEDNIIDWCEDCEENEEYIEMLAEDPKLFITEVTVEEVVG